MTTPDVPLGRAEIGEAPQAGWTPVDELEPPDPADFEDGDALDALDHPEPADAYQAPVDPDAEPVEEA